MLNFLSLSVALIGLASSPQATAPSLDRPCSFISAADMSGLVGTRVTGATDEKFRCKYALGSGWLETKLMDFSLRASKDIFDYNKNRGQAVAGLGDQSYMLGATLATRLGDVLIVVDGSNAPRPPDNAKLKAIAERIVRQIP